MATWRSLFIALCKVGCVFSQHEKSNWMTDVFKRPLTYKIFQYFINSSRCTWKITFFFTINGDFLMDIPYFELKTACPLY